MGTKSKFFRVFLLLLLSAILITLMSKAGTYAYENVFTDKTYFKKNTKIGGIDVSLQTKEEAAAEIHKKTIRWQEDAELTLTFFDKSIHFPINNISLLTDESVAAAEQGTDNKLYSDIQQAVIKEALQSVVTEEVLTKIDINKLKGEIEDWAGSINETRKMIRLEDFFLKTQDDTETELSRSELKAGEQSQISRWIGDSRTLEINPGKSFSFLDLTKAGGNIVLSDEDSSKIASAIYEAAIASGLQIVERHTSTVLPDGIKPGYEAKIKKNEMDLVLANPSAFLVSIKLQPQANGNVLVQIVSEDSAFSYRARTANLEEFEPQQITQFKKDASLGNQILTEGKPGYRVSVFRDVFDSKGNKLETKRIADDFYLPVNKVVVEEKRISIPDGTKSILPGETQNSGSGVNPDKVPGDASGQAEASTAAPENGEPVTGVQQEQKKGTQ